MIAGKETARERWTISRLRTFVSTQSLFRDTDKDGDGESNFAESPDDLADPKNGGLIDERSKKDAWNNPWIWESSAAEGEGWYDYYITSMGPDGIADTGDEMCVNDSGVIRVAEINADCSDGTPLSRD